MIYHVTYIAYFMRFSSGIKNYIVSTVALTQELVTKVIVFLLATTVSNICL